MRTDVTILSFNFVYEERQVLEEEEEEEGPSTFVSCSLSRTDHCPVPSAPWRTGNGRDVT